jgi:putative lipase involved disintegration of autophagic bodies
MMTKRILSALLAAVMLAGSLASCAAGGDETETTSDSNSTETAEQALISDALPEDLFYNDDEITIISRYKEGWTSGEIAVKELMGDPVNDAVFERNKAVESRLGVKINSIDHCFKIF